jgi:hypothetical protein
MVVLRVMVKRKIQLSFLLLFMAGHVFVYSFDLETFGYYENRFFILGSGKLSLQNIGENFSLGDYNRLRLQFRSSVSENISLNLAVDLFTFHGIIRSPLGVYESPEQSDATHTQLDRAYIDLYFPGFDITVGKQRVAMGVSYLWAPLDLFNRVNIFDPAEEKPGVNAIKVYVPIGKTSSLTGVFSPEDNFNSSKSGFRAQTQIAGIDAALTLIHWGLQNQTIYGIDLRGENFIGWWIEGGYFTSPGEKNTKLVVGFDYTFPFKTGIYWLNEFFYDESGENDMALYDFNRLLTGESFTLGRKYYFSSLRFPLTGFLSLSQTYIGNWTDGSYILSPGLNYEISQNATINTGIFFLMGTEGGEFNRDGADDVFYIWFKINF